jgi:hypothetical protein
MVITLWRIDPLLCDDCVNKDRLWATARLARSHGNEYAINNRVIFGNGVFYVWGGEWMYRSTFS